MSNLKKESSESIEDISTLPKPSRNQPERHSLPIKSHQTQNGLRHTQSQNYGKSKFRKAKPPQPVIPEQEIIHEVINENVEVRASTRRKKSKTQSIQGHDNECFQTETSAGFSRTSSVTLSQTGRISNNPSLASSSVVKEQYCWCRRNERTQCEKVSLAAIGVLIFIIIILIIVVAIVSQKNHSNASDTLKSLFQI